MTTPTAAPSIQPTAEEIDARFAALLAASPLPRRGRPPKAKPAFIPQPVKPGSNVNPTNLDRIRAMHEARKADFAKIHEGTLPGGWEFESLLMNINSYECDYCGTRGRALSPAVVFLVTHQVRHPEVKFMRPLRNGEFKYFATVVGLRTVREIIETTVPQCQNCFHLI